MKVKIDEKNRAVIAEGYYHGRHIKGVSICSKDDEFDKDFGEKLAISKYNYRETLAKIKAHEQEIKWRKATIARLIAEIDNEKNIVSALGGKLVMLNEQANSIIDEYYK